MLNNKEMYNYEWFKSSRNIPTFYSIDRMRHKPVGHGCMWIFDEHGDAHETHVRHFISLLNIKLISPVSITKRDENFYAGHVVRFNKDDNPGNINLIDRNSKDTFHLPHHVFRNGLFFMKVLPNEHNYCVHEADACFCDML